MLLVYRPIYCSFLWKRIFVLNLSNDRRTQSAMIYTRRRSREWLHISICSSVLQRWSQSATRKGKHISKEQPDGFTSVTDI